MDRIWNSALEGFPCLPGCTACCKGVLSVSIPEFQAMTAVLPPPPDPMRPPTRRGCPFRQEDRCGIYPVRPFMCRLFGFRFLHPALATQPFCPRLEVLRPGDGEAEAFRRYQAFCADEGFVLLGEPWNGNGSEAAIEDNRRAIARFPWVTRWMGFLTGRPL